MRDSYDKFLTEQGHHLAFLYDLKKDDRIALSECKLLYLEYHCQFAKIIFVFGTAVICWKWADFKRIIPNTDIQNTLAILSAKITTLEQKNAISTVGSGMVYFGINPLI